eukprot:gene309-564_t
MRPQADNNTALPPINDEQETRRRQQLIRLGLLVCFGLALMDTGSLSGGGVSSESIKAANKPKIVTDPRSELLTIKLNRLMRDVKVDMGSDVAKNATGLFKGYWKKSPNTNHTALSSSGTPSSSSSSSAQGRFIIQLRSLPIHNVANFTFVYGLMELDGFVPGGPLRSTVHPIQGVYSTADGTLTLIETPSRTQRLYFSLPSSSTTITSTPIPAVQNQKENNKYSSLSFSKSNSSVVLIPSKSRETSSSSSSSIIIPTLTLSSGNGNDIRHTDKDKDSSVENGDRADGDDGDSTYVPAMTQEESSRHLTPSPSRMLAVAVDNDASRVAVASFLTDDPALLFEMTTTLFPFSTVSVDIGTTGMKLVSVPATTLSEALRQKFVVTGGLGESALPEAFKAMQMEGFAGASTGSSSSKGKGKESVQAVAMSQCVMTASFHSDSVISYDGNTKVLDFKGAFSAHPYVSSTTSSSSPSSPCASLHGIQASATFFDLEGKLSRKASLYCWLTSAVSLAQISLLVMQLRYAQTQAASTKISIVGMTGQALLDALISIGHLLLCNIFHGEFFYYFLPVALLTLVTFCIFEMRMVIIIYQSRFAQELSVQGWAGMRQYLAMLHCRFYLCLFGAMLVLVFFQTRPVVIVLLLYSFWLPQIVYNAVAGSRRPFFPSFAICMSASRLVFPLYILGCPQNIFALIYDKEGDVASPMACLILVGWTILQVLVLHLQDRWGPRFFFPSWMLPAKYDYERPLPAHRSSGSEGDVEKGELEECVICYNGVDPWQRNYMVTPCDHVFHRDCLMQWLDHKLECPVCRAVLPSYVIMIWYQGIHGEWAYVQGCGLRGNTFSYGSLYNGSICPCRVCWVGVLAFVLIGVFVYFVDEVDIRVIFGYWFCCCGLVKKELGRISRFG